MLFPAQHFPNLQALNLKTRQLDSSQWFRAHKVGPSNKGGAFEPADDCMKFGGENDKNMASLFPTLIQAQRVPSPLASSSLPPHPHAPHQSRGPSNPVDDVILFDQQVFRVGHLEDLYTLPETNF